MAFESLTDKLQNVFKKLRSKGRLTEEDVKIALKEVKMALLEADVNFRVVKQFTKSVQERAVGQDVMNGLNPGQMVIKIVNEELVNLMGSETTELPIKPGNDLTVIMMAGLQGAGKTTTAAKLAGKIKSKGKRPLLVACDVYRPAAITQLQVNGEKQGVEVFTMGDKQSPVDIAKAAVAHAKANQQNVVIIDTAGRLHVDEDMMQELADIKAKELERQLERKSTRRSENSARVYGEIHKVLNDLSCDRVYIIQPYPLGDNHYLTILYEVTAKGVARISDFWQDIKMSELPKFTASMARNELMLIRDIDSLDGTRAKAMFSSNGTQSLIVQKLHDTTHDWVGSLVCDFTESIPDDFDEEAIRKKLHFAAMHIQYILPEVKERKL